MKKIHELYEHKDIDDYVIEVISENRYIYNKRRFQMTSEVISELEALEKETDPIFLEIIDGELVFS